AGGPLVVAQVNAVDGLVWVDGCWRGNAWVPRQAVDELGQGLTAALQLRLGAAGVVQGAEGEVAGGAAGPRGEGLKVGEDGAADVALGDKRSGFRGPCRRGGAGVNPLLEQGDVILGGAGLLALRRHFALEHALIELGRRRLARNDLAARDQLVTV